MTKNQHTSRLHHRGATSALLVSAVLTLAACGAEVHDRPTSVQPNRPADLELAWEAYYAATHPDFGRAGTPTASDLELAREAYYAATHPDPAAHGS